MSVLAILSLTGCAEPPPELPVGGALPPPISADPNAPVHSSKQDEGANAASPKSTLAEPAKRSRGANWPYGSRHDNDDLTMDDLEPDGMGYSLDFYAEGWGLDAEEPIARGAGDTVFGNSQFKSTECDPRQNDYAEEDIGCSFLADFLTTDEPELAERDEAREELKLNIYEGDEAGDVRLIWRKSTGAGVQLVIPFPR